MAKALGTVGKVVGIAALIITPFNPPLGAILSTVASAATVGSQLLAKPPIARGTLSQVIIEPDPPSPYVMGEGYFGGIQRHDTAYGPKLKKVPNPYRFIPIVYSVGGPIESISPRHNFQAVSSWYSGFLFTDTQVGLTPEPAALAPEWSGAPGWPSTAKLSGQAAIGWSFKFDKDGKRFASGLGVLGAYGKWAKTYDPRKDDTQPGGIGSHRLGDETTYEWSENPALHAGTYAFGRYQNSKRVMGMGLPADAIDWLTIMAWANVCEANNWTMFGVVYEGVGAGESERRKENLKDICFAGGAEPIPGAVLSFKYSAPKVALATVTKDDLTDDDRSIIGMQPFRDRINTVIPKYRSPAHNWELVDGAPVVNSTFLTEDGEEKRDVWPFNFVKNVKQATQLAAYRMYDSRELPFNLPCKPHMRHYRPGECLMVPDEELGLDIPAIILRRQFDPASMKVVFEMITETTAKHAYCLGQTGTAPPTPAIGQTSQEKDELAAEADSPAGLGTLKLSGSYTRNLAGNITQAHDGTGTGTVTVTIPDHIRVYADGTEASVTGGTITLDETNTYLLAYDDPDFGGGTLGSDLTIIPIDRTAGEPAGDAYFSAANPSRHFLASIFTVDEVGGGGGTGGSSPPGGGGWDGDPDTQIP